MRSKHLIWTVRVVTPEEYHLAKTQALECQREKKKFELQRFTTKRVGIKMASKLSGGIIHGSSVLPDAAEEEISILRDLEQEVDRLTTENEDLKKQCEEEQLQKESVQQSLDALSESWNFSVLQAEQAKSENKQLKELLLSTEKLISDKDSELDKLKKQVSVLTKQLMLGSSRESKLLEICEKNNKKLQNSNKLLHEKIMENHTMLSEIRKEANHFIVKTLQGNNSNGDLHTEDLILINSKKLVTVESSSLIDVIESRDHSMHKLHELAEDMVGELEEAQRFIRNNCDFMTDVAKRLKENADQLAINPK